MSTSSRSFLFFFNDTATTEIYTLSLHDALPILPGQAPDMGLLRPCAGHSCGEEEHAPTRDDCHPARMRSHRRDRKSTRLNSSHGYISYAVFCLKKKKKKKIQS